MMGTTIPPVIRHDFKHDHDFFTLSMRDSMHTCLKRVYTCRADFALRNSDGSVGGCGGDG